MTSTIRVLQWNIGLFHEQSAARIQSRVSVLTSLIKTHNPDIVTLQECSNDVTSALTRARMTHHHHRTKHRFLVTAHTGRWINPQGVPFLQKSRSLGIYLDEHNNSHQLAVWNFHLRSRKNSQDASIESEFAEEVGYTVRTSRQSRPYHSRRELLCGDFNLEPHSNAFCKFEVTRSYTWAASTKVRRDPNKWPLFNPCWTILGKQTEPLGTLYATNQIDRPWYVPDQILMSPGLGNHSEVALIERIGDQSLCKGKHREPDENIGSDHLPILLEVIQS